MNLQRRNLLQWGALSLVSGSFITAISKANSQEINFPNIDKKNLTAEEALKLLLQGNDRFVSKENTNQNRSLNRIQTVAMGQNPYAIILSCADSRVPVEILFDQGFGDLFVVRNAGNIATAQDIGSIEFGSLVLGAKVILVLGHGSCGAVKAALDGSPVPGSIQSVLDYIKPTLNSLNTEEKKDLSTAIKANVKGQIEMLKKSPIINELIEANKLIIAGGYYDLNTAKVNLIS
jgi:carbonic anhydrase